MVEVAGLPDIADLKQLERGIFLDGKKTGPSRIMLLKKKGKVSLLSVELHEGIKRQIRRMMARIECKVIWLRRVSYGGIKLRDLSPGEYRRLTEIEVKMLKKLN